MTDEDVNPRIALGSNNPPEPTPFETIKVHVDDLMLEARNWLDGSAVENSGQAKAVARLLDELRQTDRAVTDQRDTERKPHAEAVAAVNNAYKPMLTDVERAAKACKNALTPWLVKLEADRQAEADRLNAEAATQRQEAVTAVRGALGSSDIGAIEDAEELLRAAKRTARAAARTDAARSGVEGGERAVSLRSRKTATIMDEVLAIRHYWKTDPDAILEVLQKLANRDARAGRISIPGVRVDTVMEAV